MNRATHQLVAGAVTGIFLASREQTLGTATAKPILGGAAAALLTRLPDILEPATSPNHRRFFHSLAFAGLLGVALHELHGWQPETDTERLLKKIGALALSAYLIHLALDFTTAKSLPLVG